MKNEKLNEIIGTIDDEYIVEAMPEKKGRTLSMKKMSKVLIAAAVCLAIVAGTVTIRAMAIKMTNEDFVNWSYRINDHNRINMEAGKEFNKYLQEQDIESELSKALSPKGKYEWSANRYLKSGELEEIVSKYPNMALEDLPEHPFRWLSMVTHDLGISNGELFIQLTKMHNTIGLNVNYIEMLDKDHLAVIYRFYDDENIADLKPHYAAMVFGKSERAVVDIWGCASELYVIDEIHSSTEYENIHIGDKVSALYEIDPSFKFDIRRHIEQYDENGFLGYAMAQKILSDGILQVKYEFDINEINGPEDMGSLAVDPDRLITDICFYPFSEDRLSESLRSLYMYHNVSINDDTILNFLK